MILGHSWKSGKKPHVSVISKLHSLHLSLNQIRRRQTNSGTVPECLRLISRISLR